MKRVARRAGTALAVISIAIVLTAGPALAHQCINASKNDNNPAAGAQVVFGADDEIIHATKGLENRIAKGLVDPETGEGYHGIVAFDIDGDGVADAHTYQVTKDGQIPEIAQSNGPTCEGIVNIDVYLEECWTP